MLDETKKTLFLHEFLITSNNISIKPTIMKKLLSIITFIVSATIAMAQTPQQIVSQMEAEMDKHEKEGVVMDIDVKIPIAGTMTTKSYSLGEKTRMEVEAKGNKVITWTDGKTTWIYDSKKNEIEIKKASQDASESEDDMEMFSGLTEGYDVTIDKETDTDWHLLCKKSKSNKDKDAPKKINLVVAKKTFMPKSLSFKAFGVTMTMRIISFGVTEEQVTFDPKKYPKATIVDKRN